MNFLIKTYKKIEQYTLGLIVFLLLISGIFTSMLVGGFVPFLTGYSLWVYIMIPAIAGSLGILILVKSFKIGIFFGISNALMVIFSWIYFSIIFPSRSVFLKIEIALPVGLALVIGMFPVMVFFKNNEADENIEKEN